MSRSRRHTPIFGHTCAESEKYDKRMANRRLRRLLNQSPPDEDVILPELKEVSNVWSFQKDGKHWWQDPDGEYLKHMRK